MHSNALHRNVLTVLRPRRRSAVSCALLHPDRPVRRLPHLLLAAAALAAPALAAQTPAKGAAPKAPATPAPADPKASVAPAAPAWVRAELTASNRITVTWSPVPGAESYIVGRGTPNTGFRRLQVPDARATTYEDFDVAPDQRYIYQVAAVRAGVAGMRTQSDTVKGPAPALGGGAGGGGARPVGKRYRISVIGLWAARQTLDHPLQLDGKGDEIYLAAHVAHLDTTRDDVVEHAVLRTDVMGDVNGFSDRIAMGSANGPNGAGGFVSGDRVPGINLGAANVKGRHPVFPFVLFEGELIPGASAVAITPTIWEWDGNAELLERWVIGRKQRVADLVRPGLLAPSLASLHYVPMELAAPALMLPTGREGMRRDRPIGMEHGKPQDMAATELYAASNNKYLDEKSAGEPGAGTQTKSGGFGLGAYVSVAGSVARALSPVLREIARIIEQALGPTTSAIEPLLDAAARFVGRMPAKGVSIETSKRLGLTSKNAVRLDPPEKGYTAPRIDSLRKSTTFSRTGIGGIVPRLLGVVRRATGVQETYLFEKMIVLTPAGIDRLFASSPGGAARPPAVIEFHYADTEAMKGRYTLYVQVERLP